MQTTLARLDLSLESPTILAVGAAPAVCDSCMCAVNSDEHMCGSFGPQEAAYTVTTPRKDWDEIPSGMMYRGKASVTHEVSINRSLCF